MRLYSSLFCKSKDIFKTKSTFQVRTSFLLMYLSRDEILKALTGVKPGLCVCLDQSKDQVKTRVLDGLEFSKNQPPWVFSFQGLGL